jgi:hypothetical protein
MENYVFNKYLRANIEMFFEFNVDGSIKTLDDYMNINFEKCDKLPEHINSQNKDLLNNIIDLIRGGSPVYSDDDVDEFSMETMPINQLKIRDSTEGSSNKNVHLYIKQEELSNHKIIPRNNISFKNKKYNVNRFTLKKR